MSHFDITLARTFEAHLSTRPDLSDRLTGSDRKQLLTYIGLIAKWNKVFNLTSVRSAEEMATHHLLDCVCAVMAMRDFRAPNERWNTVVDVGSGAGLPGVIMAILWPETAIHCVDAVAKKTSFIAQVRAEMHLQNLHAHHARIESFKLMHQGVQRYPDLITCRAYSSLKQFLETVALGIDPKTTLIAMKGKADLNQQELEQAAAQRQAMGLSIAAISDLAVPGLAAERQLIILQTKLQQNIDQAVTISKIQKDPPIPQLTTSSISENI
jgi:16S rRNA (guanine527-N7)-methyltransferase